jgi:4-amino-4-deoxy-L-arabinose transferase-like glycosyltransferase
MAVISEHKARKGFGNLGIAALGGFATASHLCVIAVLVVMSLAAFLPGFFQIPTVDLDEARFAQATKRMIETGDYVDVRFQDETRYKKPVGIYWLHAVVVEIAETVDGAEASLLRAAVGSIMLSIAAYAVTFPAMRGLFSLVALANYVRGANCHDPGQAITIAAYRSERAL